VSWQSLLIADDISGNDSDAVTTWTARKLNAPTQATAGAKPTLKKNIVNGRAAVRFDGTADYLSFGDPADMQIDNTVTVFIVHKTAAATRQTLFGQEGTANAMAIEMLSTASYRGAMIEGVFTATGVCNWAGGEFEILTYRRSANTHTLRVNGIGITLIDNAASDYSGNGTKVLGRRKEGSPPQYYNGDMAAFGISGDALSDANVLAVEQWLSSYYGITSYTNDWQGHLEDMDGFDFSLVFMPDTQYHASTSPSTYTSIMNWIASKASAMSIKGAFSVGDVVDTSNTTQWDIADGAFDILDAAEIPYLISPGNHDYDAQDGVRAFTEYNSYFPRTRWTAHSWWTGAGDFQSGSVSDNSYYLFTAGGRNFIIISMEFGPKQATLDWAAGLLTTHSTRDAIILTHSFLDSDGTRMTTGDVWNPHDLITSDADTHDGEEMWTDLVKLYANIRMVVCGHITQRVKRADDGDNGNKVNQFLMCWHLQDADQDGYVRIMKFNLAGKTCRVFTYGPHGDVHLRDTQNYFEFTYEY
jgi:hypothetical protein